VVRPLSIPLSIKLIILLDMDGDGRADYCLIYDDDNGKDNSLHCWRNGGVGDVPAYWQEMSGSNTYILGPQNDLEIQPDGLFIIGDGVILRNPCST
jgi:hypothetical protein